MRHEYQTVEGDEVVLGGTYETRGGDYVEVTSLGGHEVFPVVVSYMDDEFDDALTWDGHSKRSREPNGGDLMRRVKT
jgi:hypothetical protein